MNNEDALPSGAGTSVSENTSLLADTQFLESLRRQMLKFATLQLSDAHLAEDAVQEALIGALKNAGSFGGRAALKTWVFAILKNKIADTSTYTAATTASICNDFFSSRSILISRQRY